MSSAETISPNPGLRPTIALGLVKIAVSCAYITRLHPILDSVKALYKAVYATNHQQDHGVTARAVACIFAACRQNAIVMDFVPLCHELDAEIDSTIQALWIVEHYMAGATLGARPPAVACMPSSRPHKDAYTIDGELQKIELNWFNGVSFTLCGDYGSTMPMLLEFYAGGKLKELEVAKRASDRDFKGKPQLSLSKEVQSAGVPRVKTGGNSYEELEEVGLISKSASAGTKAIFHPSSSRVAKSSEAAPSSNNTKGNKSADAALDLRYFKVPKSVVAVPLSSSAKATTSADAALDSSAAKAIKRDNDIHNLNKAKTTKSADITPDFNNLNAGKRTESAKARPTNRVENEKLPINVAKNEEAECDSIESNKGEAKIEDWVDVDGKGLLMAKNGRRGWAGALRGVFG